MKRTRWLFAGILLGGLAVAILFNRQQTKEEEQQKKEVRDELLKQMGADESKLDTLNASFENLVNGTESIEAVKGKLADTVSEGIVDTAKEQAHDLAQKGVQKAKDEVSDISKEQLAEYAKKGLTEATESLPYFTEEDVDDMVAKIVEKVSSTLSEENLKEFLEATGSFDEFNGVLTEKVTSDNMGYLGKFMKKWIENMPDINQVDPANHTKEGK